MGFLFIIAVLGIVIWLIVKRQGGVAEEWSQAANRLGLNYSRGGLFNPHWIYGKKAGLRYDVKTFNRSSGGTPNQKWTGYRVRFHRSADMRIRVTEKARKQLSSRFQECEIDDEGIFCARPGVERDAPGIIDNIERLQSVTGRLLAAADEEPAPVKVPEVPAMVPPPRPPEKSSESASAEPPPEPEPPSEKTVSLADIMKEASDSKNPEADEESRDSVFELASEVDDEPEVEDVQEDESAEEEPAGAESDAALDSPPAPVSASLEPLMTLETVSHDLFDAGRNRFQITQQFDAEYSGLSMMGEGKLIRAEPYSNDRIFGRGPGTLAEIEIDHPEEPIPGHNTIKAVLQLPETASPRALREHIGDTVTISGTLIRCDAFDGRIFLEAGEIA